MGLIYHPRDIIEDIRRDYSVNITYERAYRAREYALVFIWESPEGSYALVKAYGKALKLVNSDTVFDVKIEDVSTSNVFMALGWCIWKFMNCINPVIVVKGMHLHKKYKVILLIATCIDGNNNIYIWLCLPL